MKVICYGDSNTYGFDPRGWLGERYGADDRWVDILARRTGWEILNWGMNGREIPSQAPAFPADTDLLMVMLGTNDLLQGRTPSETAQRMLRFLAGLTAKHDKILLISQHLLLITFSPLSHARRERSRRPNCRAKAGNFQFFQFRRSRSSAWDSRRET